MKINLKEHIANLQKRELSKVLSSDNSLLFVGTHLDKEFLPHLKACVGSCTVHLKIGTVSTVTEVLMHAKAKGVTRVISTNIDLLKKLLNWQKRKAPSLDSYTGSYFVREGVEIVFIRPIKQLVTIPFVKFLTTRIVTKLTNPDGWYVPTEFTWRLIEDHQAEYDLLATADLICIDIETVREDAAIRCISYTGFWLDSHTSVSLELPMNSELNLTWMRKYNLLAPAKIFQNGKYDIAYLARYNAPVVNWLWDTAHLFHSWYSELPKDLGFLNSFFIREATYWKDLSETDDLHEYYRYNCLDTWGTGNAFLAMLRESPQWALENYKKEFPLVFPCHLAEMTGIKRDMPALVKAKNEQQLIVDTLGKELDTMLGVTGFNVKSNPQMKSLLKVLGCGDMKSADAKHLTKAAYRHPLNNRVLTKVLEIRKARDLVSKYLMPGKEFLATDRILYALNPHGTDTSRLASKEHHFWCGINKQNIPRGPIVKQTFIADEGFLMCEVDLAQAESRDTAYIAGEEALIHAVEYSPDFHSNNASKFFGKAFELIYDAIKKEVLDKPMRQLSKNVNHGANYNMGAATLVLTMGEDAIFKARRLLGLPRFMTAVQIAQHLIDQFHRTYPGLRETFYTGVVNEIAKTHMLTHHLVGESGWTRYCFKNPAANKEHLNAYIAHPPQSLNAQTLNKAWLNVFLKVALPNPTTFKLCSQIHDSIFFQHRIGHEHHKQEIVEAMQIPVTIKGYDDKVRTFTVPAEASNSGTNWAQLK